MANRGFSAEQVIGKLREAEVLMSKGRTARQAVRKTSISEHTYYRWWREYGGLAPENAKYPLRNWRQNQGTVRT